MASVPQGAQGRVRPHQEGPRDARDPPDPVVANSQGRGRSNARIGREALGQLAKNKFERRERPQRAVGRRHHVRPNGRGLAVPRRGDRRVASGGGRLVHVSDRIAERLATGALGQAVGRENPPDDHALVFHDDQGARYASRAFRRCLEPYGVAQSMSGPGQSLGQRRGEAAHRTMGGRKAGGIQVHRALPQHPGSALFPGISGSMRIRARCCLRKLR